MNPKYTKKTVKHGGVSIMVCGCFVASGVGSLLKIDITKISLETYYMENMPIIWHLLGYFSKQWSATLLPMMSSRDITKRASMFCNGHRRVPTWTLLRICGEFLNESLTKENHQIRTICDEFAWSLKENHPSTSAHVLWIQCQALRHCF